MLRLTGLPAVATAPEVRVERSGETLVLWFLGAPGAPPVRRIDVPLRLLGPEVDAETAALDLLAQLGRMGYTASPVAPPEGG